MALFKGIHHLCNCNLVFHLIYHLLPNVWKASYTISASIFVDVPYSPSYSTDKFISCVVPGPSQWIFDEEIVIAWSHIQWIHWMFHNPPLAVYHRCGLMVTSLPLTQRARVRSPAGWVFLVEVFPGFFSTVRQMTGKLRPQLSPDIIGHHNQH